VSFARRRGRARILLASLLVCAAGSGVLSAASVAQVLPMPPPGLVASFDGQRLQESTPAPTPQPTPALAPHPTPSVPQPPQASPQPPAEKPWPPFVPQQYVFPTQMPPPPGPAWNIPGPPGSDPLSFCPFCGEDPREDAPTVEDIQRESVRLESLPSVVPERVESFPLNIP
jgi:hypothetical protein